VATVCHAHLAAVILVGLLVSAGTTLILDGWMRRPKRPDLAKRLLPFQPDSLADEARQWLETKPERPSSRTRMGHRRGGGELLYEQR
jgi:hypothetical protein